MSTTVDQIKERLSIADLVSSYIKLEKSGKNFKARCPFHNEKTPSFFVSPERGSYHCFGCNVGGDIFSFVEAIEGVQFKEALKILADRAGVPIVIESDGEMKGKERLYRALEDALSLYEETLTKHPRARVYLKDRGLTDETIHSFHIGYALPEWNFLTSQLTARGFRGDELLRAGLSIEKDGRYYDRFRGRIMFPLADHTGRVIAFSGRVFENSDPNVGKYINSPETLLFNKSHVLYAFDKAKGAIREQNTCILVEGQMDVIMSHQAGVHHAVGTSGTALSDHHLTLISRLADTLIIAFDGDEAGTSASGRSIGAALLKGFDVKMIRLPQGRDPAECIKSDPSFWKNEVSSALHIVYFYLRVLEDEPNIRTKRKKAEEIIIPYIAKIKSKVDQAHFVGEVAKALRLPEEPLWESLRQHVEQYEKNIPYLKNRETIRRTEKLHNFEEKIISKIIALCAWCKKNHVSLKESASYIERIETFLGEKWNDISNRFDNRNIEKLLFEIETMPPSAPDVELNELVLNLEEQVTRSRLWKSTNDLKYAEEKKDDKMIEEKIKECQHISKTLDQIVKRKGDSSK